MTTLTLAPGEKAVLLPAGPVVLTVCRVKGGKVLLGFECDRRVSVKLAEKAEPKAVQKEGE